MSKQKKKKQNKEQLEKIAKAQAKNEFLRRLKRLLTVIGCEAVFDMIPQHMMDNLFLYRWQSVKVVGDTENTFHTDDLKWYKKALVHMLKDKMMDLDMGGPEIDVYTYQTVGLTLKNFSQPICEKYLKNYPQYHDILKRYYDSDDQIDTMIEYLISANEYICFLISDLRTCIYWTKPDSKILDNRLAAGFTVTIHSAVPEKKNFIINRELHTALRVGWTIKSSPEWVSIRPESIGLRQIGKDNLIDVYIQDHALRRMIERNDCIYVQYLWMYLNGSVYDMKYHLHKDNGKYMIEFKVFEIKTGYLVAQLIDTRLVIQTFLFLTNDGTPEGLKLRENLGIEKADKEYLKIDKLSTFIAPEVQSNEKIRKVFHDAGCESLFRLKAELEKRDILLRKPVSASLIEDYLMLNEEKTTGFYPEEEEGNHNE